MISSPVPRIIVEMHPSELIGLASGRFKKFSCRTVTYEVVVMLSSRSDINEAQELAAQAAQEAYDRKRSEEET